MKIKEKMGFTLIEMLVCIGIIAALGVVIGLSATKVLSDTQKNDNREIMQEIFDAAHIYYELSTGHCATSGYSACPIAISEIISKGLLDEEILEKENPMHTSYHQNFLGTDTVSIIINAYKEKEAEYVSGSCKLKEKNLEDWTGGCD